MAFPQVEATNNSIEQFNTFSHTIDLPANIQAGETLLVFFACDGGETVTFPPGWTKIYDHFFTIYVTLVVAWRKADGEEGASITVTTGTEEQSAHISYRISGATDPTETAPEASAAADGTSANPDPISLTAAGGSKEYLWIAVEGNDDSDMVNAYPADYTNGETYESGAVSGACVIGIARRELETDTEDPGSFTLDASEQWVVCTVAVYPAINVTGLENKSANMGSKMVGEGLI